MKKQSNSKQTSYNLFEPQAAPALEPTNDSKQSSPPPPKIKDACPRCGSRSALSKRPQESGGSHYCLGGCLSDDRTDCFYFTPVAPRVESFDEAAAREEAKKIIASENVVSSDAAVEQETLNYTALAVEEEPVNVSASKFDQEQLFVQPVIEASGKTIESLEYSRAKTTEIMRRFNGELPMSIMKADKKSRGAADLGTGSYDASTEHRGIWGVSGRGCANGALSVFPQNIGKALLLLYTSERDTVFDPFAGHNSRMEFCVRADRHYIGCDVSKKFMAFNEERAALLRKEYPDIFIKLYEMDSRKCGELEEEADFTITSPPYYDIEYYGDEHQQLGKSKNYFEFLRSMARVVAGNYKQLKRGAFCVYFINDFRREGRFHAYHIDMYNILKDAGFTPWDMLITDLGQPLRACFPAQVIEAQILPKRHEYGVVMRKL